MFIYEEFKVEDAKHLVINYNENSKAIHEPRQPHVLLRRVSQQMYNLMYAFIVVSQISQGKTDHNAYFDCLCLVSTDC